MSDLWLLLPVSIMCWTIAARMFWVWDIGGYRSEYERKNLDASRKEKFDKAKKIMEEAK